MYRSRLIFNICSRGKIYIAFAVIACIMGVAGGTDLVMADNGITVSVATAESKFPDAICPIWGVQGLEL